MRKISIQKTLPIILSAASAMISLMTTYFIAKPLGPDLYGKIQFYVGVIQTTSLICSFGSNYFLTKNIQFHSSKKAFFTKTLVVIFFWFLFVSPIFFNVANTLLTTFNQNHLTILIVLLCSLCTSIMSCVGGYYLGTYKPANSTLFENFLPKTALFIISILIIYVFGMGVSFADIYIYIYLGIYGFGSIVFLIVLLRKTKISFTKSEVVSLLSFFALTTTYSLNSSLSKIIAAEYYNSFSGVGAYSLSVQIISVSKLFSGVIINMSKPHFTKYKGNNFLLFEYFRKITRISAYVVIPFCFGFITQAKFILSIFGEDYSVFSFMLVLLSIDTLITELTGPNGNLLAMTNHEKIELFNGFLNIGIFLFFAYLFKEIGILGLPIAILTSTTITNIFKIIEIYVLFKTNPYNIKMLVHYLIMSLISFSTFSLISLINNIYIILILDIVCGILLIVLFNIINPNKEDKYFFLKK